MKKLSNHPKSMNLHGAKETASPKVAGDRPKPIRLAPKGRRTGRTWKELVELIDSSEAKRTAKEAARQIPRAGTAAALVASAEYREAAAVSLAADIECRQLRKAEKARMRSWRKKHGAVVRALLIEAFKIPTLLALPAPGNITRKFDDPWRYPPRPFDARINPGKRRFEGYRPQWVIDAERTVGIAPSHFLHVRQYALNMTREQCAAFLRVEPIDVARWEDGTEQIPFAAYWLLVTISRTQVFRHLRPEWDGWRIIDAGADIGKLLDPYSGRCYTAHEISNIPRQWSELSIMQGRVRGLEARLAEAEAENTRLRQAFASQGITDELRSMHARLSTLLAEVGTAQIVEFPQVAEAAQQPMRATR